MTAWPSWDIGCNRPCLRSGGWSWERGPREREGPAVHGAARRRRTHPPPQRPRRTRPIRQRNRVTPRRATRPHLRCTPSPGVNTCVNTRPSTYPLTRPHAYVNSPTRFVPALDADTDTNGAVRVKSNSSLYTVPPDVTAPTRHRNVPAVPDRYVNEIPGLPRRITRPHLRPTPTTTHQHLGEHLNARSTTHTTPRIRQRTNPLRTRTRRRHRHQRRRPHQLNLIAQHRPTRRHRTHPKTVRPSNRRPIRQRNRVIPRRTRHRRLRQNPPISSQHLGEHLNTRRTTHHTPHKRQHTTRFDPAVKAVTDTAGTTTDSVVSVGTDDSVDSAGTDDPDGTDDSVDSAGTDDPDGTDGTDDSVDSAGTDDPDGTDDSVDSAGTVGTDDSVDSDGTVVSVGTVGTVRTMSNSSLNNGPSGVSATTRYLYVPAASTPNDNGISKAAVRIKDADLGLQPLLGIEHLGPNARSARRHRAADGCNLANRSRIIPLHHEIGSRHTTDRERNRSSQHQQRHDNGNQPTPHDHRLSRWGRRLGSPHASCTACGRRNYPTCNESQSAIAPAPLGVR